MDSSVLDLIGQKGTPKLLWALRGGRTATFRVLAEAVELAPGTLNERLKDLRRQKLLVLDSGYRLTVDGEALARALRPLVRWGEDRAGREGAGDHGEGVGARRGLLQGH